MIANSDPIHTPEGFDPSCNLCNLARHNCPGCGADVPHGTVACEACSNPADRQPLACTCPDDDKRACPVHDLDERRPRVVCRCLITAHVPYCPWVPGEMAVDLSLIHI